MSSEKWAGIVVERNSLTLAVFSIAAGDEPRRATMIDDRTIPLQSGQRGPAYKVIRDWLVTFLREASVTNVAVKSSAVMHRMAATMGLLESAELRGVVILAVVEAGIPLYVVKKQVTSRTFGSRKVDDYVDDSTFWTAQFSGALRKGSREAAFLAYAAACED